VRFANPLYLLLLLILPYLLWHWKKARQPAFFHPFAEIFKSIGQASRVQLLPLVQILKITAVAFFIIALARPQAGQKSEEIYNQGIDIMLVMDTSSSMRALDFKPADRISAARNTAKEFVKARNYDRIGIAVFSAFAYTQCPLTVDHDAALNFLDQVDVGMTQNDGTAIGSAIATAANRLKNSTGKSRVLILLTDGRNNMGEIDPLTASQAAAALDIKIYTIGCGAPGGALYPVDDPVWGRQYVKIPEQELDENTLAKIAETSGGRYFRATDTESLKKIFEQIDKMEKTDIKTVKYTSYTELAGFLMWPAFAMFLFELFLSYFFLRRIP